MVKFGEHRRSAILLAFSTFLTSSALADTVDQGSIANFGDGQPALAGEVNGNFSELINQINDNAVRIADIEANGLVVEPASVSVDCGADGPTALQDAINDARNPSTLLIISAVGTCNGIFVGNRDVLIVTTPAGLTLVSDGGSEAAVVQYGRLQFNAISSGGGTITLDGVGAAQTTLRTGSYGYVGLLGPVTVIGATRENIGVFSGGQLFIGGGTTTVGSNADNAVGIRVEQSLLLFAGLAGGSTLNINSGGNPMLLDDSVFETFSLDGTSATLLNIPNGGGAVEIEIVDGSTALLGPSNITVGTVRVTDNSSVNLDSSLFFSGSTAAWNGKLLLDRGSNLRLNVEEGPSDMSFVHTGGAEVGVNSNLEVFGVGGSPDTMTVGAGGGNLQVNVGASVILNNAELGSGSVKVLDARLIFSDNASFTGTQPTIDLSFSGQLIDFGGALTGDVSSCSTGSIAYDATDPLPVNHLEACP